MELSEFTVAHWKVLELSFDCVSLPHLIQEHSFIGFPEGDSVIPETTIEATAKAVRDLVTVGAVRVVDETHTLTIEEVEVIVADRTSFDPVNGAFLVEVVDEPLAADYQSRRPRDANPHRPIA